MSLISSTYRSVRKLFRDDLRPEGMIGRRAQSQGHKIDYSLEQFEPRILLSADGLLNAIIPDQSQVPLQDSIQEVVQYAELLETNNEEISEQLPVIEQLVDQEPEPSDTFENNLYEPIVTLFINHDNTDTDGPVDVLSNSVEDTENKNTLTEFVDTNFDAEVTNISAVSTEDSSMPIYINDADISIEYATSIEIRGPPLSETVNSEITTYCNDNEDSEVDSNILDEYATEVQPSGTSGSSGLSGLYLVDPTVDYFDGQIVYLDFDGAEDVVYNGPVTVGPFDVTAFRAPGDLAGQEQVIIAEVMGSLEHIFAGSGIIFTTERPSGNQPYSTIYVGGDDYAFAEYPSFLGLAEQIDVGNQDLDDAGLVFAQNVPANSSTKGYGLALAHVIAHETGHLIGYAHNHEVSISILEGEAPLTYQIIGPTDDGFGLVQHFAELQLTIDTTAPVVTVDTLLTKDKTPELTGTIDDPDATLTVIVDDNSYSAVNNGDGTWTLADDAISPALVEGLYDVEVIATDLAGNIGTDTGIDELTISLLLSVDSLEVIPSGFIVHFNRQVDPDVLNLYDTKAGTYGQADFTVVGNTVGPVAGSLIYNEEAKIVSFIKTGGPLEPDTYTITLRSGADAFKDSEGYLLDGDADDVEGGDYVTTVTIEPTTARLMAIPDFTRGPGQTVNVPATDSGIPVTISDGSGILAVDFVFDYDPALLSVTGVSLASGLPSSWGLSCNLSTPGHVAITVYGLTPLDAGQARLAEIKANVPDDAAYTSAAILGLSNIQINEGAIVSQADCAVHIAAYLGDVTGNHRYSGLDAAYIARVAVGLDSGFAAYRLKDPAIVADVTGNYRLSGLDAAYVARKVVGFEQPQIQDLPDPLPGIIADDPYPLLSIPENITAYRGSTITVPILVDDATGLMAADIDLQYDTNVFDLSNSDVHLGSLTSGWSLVPNVNDSTGQIKMVMYSFSPLTGGSGSLTELEFFVRADATLGTTIIDLMDTCKLNDGALVLTLQDGELSILDEGDQTPPTLVGWSLDQDTGVDSNDKLTNDSTPQLVFTFSEVVFGEDNDVIIHDPNSNPITPDSIAGWGSDTLVIVFAAPLALDGEYTVTLNGTTTIKDETGNPLNGGANEVVSFTLDTTAPLVTVDTLVTHDVTPQLTGTVNDTGVVVEVTVGDNTYTANNNGNGTWTLADDTISPSLAEGIYDVSVTSADPAGNMGTDNTADELTVGATAPAVTVDILDTDDSTPELTGTVDDPFATLEVTVDGNVYTAINNSDGSWTLADDAISPALVMGTYDIKVVATDPAGNIGVDATIDELVILSDVPLFRIISTEIVSSGFTSYFNHQLDISDLNLYDTMDGLYGAADLTIVGDTVGPVAGSLIYHVETRSVSFVKTGGPLEPDTYTITLRGAGNAFRDSQGNPLDGDADGIAGGDYITTIVVAPSTARLLSLPDFARGPGQIINIPATNSGIPVTISDGTDVQVVDFVFEYDPELLNVTGIFRGAGMPGDWSIVYNLSTPGHVPVTVYGSSPLSAGQIRLADIQASVPSDVVYASSAVLSLSSIHVNKGTIAVEGDSGVQVVAYYGDATGNYAYSGLDASYISRVAAGLESGFATTYRLKDPVIVGDVTGNGRLSALDAAYVARKAVGMDVSQIPDLAGTLQPLIVVDPLLSIPDDLSAYPGDTLNVAVSILDDAADLIAVDLYMNYDTSVFDLTSADVVTGELTDGWMIITNVSDAAGTIGVLMFGTEFLPAGTTGSVAEINFTVRADAPTGATVLDITDDTALNEGELVVTLDDGTVTIKSLNDDPVAVNDEVTTDADTPVDITVAELLSNDWDPDLGDTVNFVDVDDTGMAGTLIDNGDGSYTYDPEGYFDYLAEGESTTQTFSYRVDDGKGGQATAEVTIIINGVNDAPEVTTLTTHPEPLDEDGTLTLEGEFADPDSSGAFAVTVVDWGDGSAPDISIRLPGITDFSFTHRYFDDVPSDTPSDFYTITVTVEDDTSESVTEQVTATVNNVAPTLSGIAASDVVNENGVTSLTGTISDPGTLDTFTLSVDWGDGTPVEEFMYPAGTTFFSETHQYLDDDPSGTASDLYTVIVTVEDDDLGSDTEDVGVTVTNIAPTLSGVSATDADEGSLSTLTGTITDTGTQDTFTLSVDWDDGTPVDFFSYPAGTTVFSETHTYANDGNYTINLTVEDDDLGEDTAILIVTVNDLGPTAVLIGDTVLDEGQPGSFDASGSTSFSDAIVAYEWDWDYDGVTFTPSGDTGSTQTHAWLDDGTYTVAVRVTDDDGSTDIATLTVTVTLVNEAPVANDDSSTVAEGGTVAVDVLANDTDPEGDTLTVDSITQPTNGTAVLNPDDTVTYTPNADYNGVDTFTYTVSDGNGGTDTATVTVTVTPVNDDPDAVDDNTTTAENSAVIIDVLANDTDVDGDTLTVISVSDPAHGAAVINLDNTVTYTPDENYNGSDSFTYTISDGNGGTDTATVNLTVTPVNDAPMAENDTATTAEDTAVAIDVLVNDTDVDGDTLSIASVGLPANGSASISAGEITYTPDENFNGTDSFTYTISDGNGGTDTATVTVTVSAVNDAPVAGNDTATTNEDAAVSIDVLANDTDIDGDTLSIASVGLPANGSASIIAGEVTYTPDANFNGTDSFSYTVSDGNGGTDTATVTVNVGAVNDAPVAVDDAYMTDEETPLIVAAPGVLGNDSDPDGDPLTAVLVSGPSSGSLTLNANGSFTYTPDPDFNGTDSFTYQANDGTVNSNVATVTITVNPVNDAPVANDDAATTDEDVAVTVDVLANDTDVDGDTLTVVSVTPPANGTAVDNGDGTITYTPDSNFIGPDSFTYTASDGNGGTDTATVTVNVGAVNDAPVAVDDAYMTDEETPLIVAAPGVLGNDSDPDGDPLTAVLVSGPSSGSLTLNANGSFTYTPDPDFNGTDSFTYQANDGTVNSNVATVTITVNPVNDAPVANDDAATTDEDVAVTVDVLANDTDVDGDTLTVTSVSDPANGTAVDNGDGTVTYTPGADYNGSDSFTYTIGDGQGGSDTATVNITVNAVNDAPDAVDDNTTTAENSAVIIDVLANDTDVDGDTLTVISVSDPAHGAAVINLDNTVTYTPDENYNGSDSFTYTISDGNGGTDTATVTVTVSAVNDAPVAGNDTATTNEDTAVSIDVLANDTDIDGDTLSIASVGLPANGSASISAGEVTYTPDANFNGTDSFSYTVSDGNGGTDTATVTVNVGAVNDAPVAVDDAYMTDEETPLIVAAPGVLGNDSDPDGDPLTAVLVSGPSSGSLTLNADGSFSYTSNLNFNGIDTFTYTVSDGNGGTDTATVTVTVTPVNDDPIANDDSATTPEDTPVDINVLANDTDVDPDTLTVSAVTQGTNGSVTNNGSDVTYTPNAGFNGIDTFTYTVSDGNGGTDTATVTVTVTPVNDDPIANDDSATTPEDTPVDINVLANDTDVDPDTLTVSAVTQGTNGSVTNNGSDVTYTPNADFNGIDTFTYTVSDGNGGTDTATVTVTVTPVNDDPIANDDSATTPEDTPVDINVLANDTDVDGDTLTVVSVTPPANGTAVDNGDGTITYTPDSNFIGPDSFTYTASDGNGGTDTATVTVNVGAVNDAPVAVDDAYMTDEETPLIVAAPGVLGNDSDPDGDPLTAVLVSGPSSGSLTLNANGSFTYTPDPDFNGTDSFTYQANDGTVNSNVATVTITVNPVNDAPVANDDAATTDEDVAVTVDVLANDTDVDGDTLTVVSVTPPANGTAVDNGDGTITYTPDSNFIGPDSFTYTASDGNGGTDTATVTVNVGAVNDAPVAVDDAYMTDEETPLIVAAPGVLGNDSDPDGDPLTAVLVSGPSSGSLTLNANGSFTYTPDPDFNGTDSFTYQANDGTVNSNVATVTITVNPVNDAPVANDDAATTDEDVAVTFDVLANDTDVDGDTLSVSSVSDPAHGAAVINLDNTVTYTPDENYNGSDSFTYTISDGNGGTDTATVTVTVTPVNDDPIANDDSATTPEDTPVDINVLANDTDVDGDTLTLVSVTPPANGTAVDNGDGTITYTPDSNFIGPDSFTYTASDGNGGTDTAAVTVTVSAVNDAPVAGNDTATTNEDAAVSIDVLVNDTDIDGDTLSIASVGLPANGSASISAGEITYTPDENFNGTDSFSYTVSDGNGGTDTATVTVTVSAVNDAPVAGNDTATTNEDAAVSIDVLVNDTDIDGDTLSIASVGLPANGSASISAGEITYTPDANFNGTDSFSYTVSDGNGGTDTATVTVTVNAVNDAPVAGNDSASTQEDTSVSIDVLANDTDIDGDTLSIASVGLPANGNASISAGEITYTPDENFNGTDSFTYTISDGNGGTDTATVNLTVTPVNDAPVANDDAATTDEDVAVTVDVLANDTDVDGDTLTVVSVTPPANGTAVDNGDGTITYTPDSNFIGPDSFTYTASDGNGGTDTATVTVNVGAVNDAPVAVDDAYMTDEETPLIVAAPGVLGNDSDPDGDPLTAVLVSGPSSGSLTLNANGSFTYTPDPDFNGTDSFTYQANDGTVNSNVATVTITVNPVNDAPVANDDAATTDEDVAVTVDVLANDTDVDGDTLTAVLDSAPSNGSLTLNADGSFTYTPDTSFTGVDTFTYHANDGTANSNIATVTITVYIPTPTQVVVDDLVSVSGDIVRYDRQTGQSSVEFTITNTSDTAIEGPIWLVVENISDPNITLANSDGITSDGKLYIDLSTHLDDGRLDPGESVTIRLYFNNPDRLRFTFEPTVLGVILP